MRIKQLSIIGFGKFVDTNIDFSDTCQMFYGENETGKTTIYHFIQYMLFGFPRNANSRRDYRPMNSSAFGGSITIEVEDELYRVERFKDKNKARATLHLPNGETKGDKALAKLLYPLNQETFQQVFSIDQNVLLDMNKVSADNFNQQLFSLGLSGTNQLLETQKEALSQAEMLYKPRGNKPPLNQLFVEYEKLKKKIEAKKADQVEYTKVLTNLVNVEQEISQKESEISDLNETYVSMNRQNAAFE
ncbi:MAG: AAA family ATPase, partial [Streptococcaceae bacterium]|nr:AAA family ATPase [Streptococcaceae bacterium]